MKRILVIADDLTGAAELAGISAQFGLRVSLSTGASIRFDAKADVIVIDTDSRNGSVRASAQHVRSALDALPLDRFDLIYKKTDSVLRGQVLAELDALLRATNRRAVLYLPQNPSRGRTIERGIYHVNGTKLHRTEFANDPLHPATSSDIFDLLDAHPNYPRIHLAGVESSLEHGIMTADASTVATLRTFARRRPSLTLPAGGADFFQATLAALGLKKSAVAAPADLAKPPALFVCGTLSVQRARLIEHANKSGATVITSGTRVEPLVAHRLCVLVAPEAKGDARNVEMTLVKHAAALLARHEFSAVFVEGGSTAAALCGAMRWTRFDVLGEHAPGVVAMRPRGTRRGPTLSMKPGSYAWPRSVLKLLDHSGRIKR